MKILLVQPCLNPPGGGNGVANWMIEALLKLGEVKLLCCTPPDWNAIDAYYGTRLAARRLPVKLVPVPGSHWLRRFGIPYAHLELHWMMRQAARLCGSFNLVCAANNEFALPEPVPLVHYIHFPWNSYPRPDIPAGWDRPPFNWILQVYYAVCRWVSGFRDPRKLDRNLTLVNSVWTGKQYRQLYGAQAPVHVLFPPALGGAPTNRSWEQRRTAFLSVGRVAPEKRWPELVAIFDQLRQRGYPVNLTLAGSSNHPEERQAVERLASTRSWLQVQLDLTRAQLAELTAEHRYGIHAMIDEHYGMAVAELVRGGCLTFVHDSGGAAAIVSDPRQRWSNRDQAVEGIAAVLDSPELQAQLRPTVARSSDTDRFQAELLELVGQFLGRGR